VGGVAGVTAAFGVLSVLVARDQQEGMAARGVAALRRDPATSTTGRHEIIGDFATIVASGARLIERDLL
jgi:hypothetical protein